MKLTARPAGRWSVDADRWLELVELAAAGCVALGEPWPEWLIEQDLLWMADQHALWIRNADTPARRRPGLAAIPGCRELAERWNLRTQGGAPAKNRANAYMREVLAARDTRGTEAGRSRDAAGTPEHGPTPNIDGKRDVSRTPHGRPRDDFGYARGIQGVIADPSVFRPTDGSRGRAPEPGGSVRPSDLAAVLTAWFEATGAVGGHLDEGEQRAVVAAIAAHGVDAIVGICRWIQRAPPDRRWGRKAPGFYAERSPAWALTGTRLANALGWSAAWLALPEERRPDRTRPVTPMAGPSVGADAVPEPVARFEPTTDTDAAAVADAVGALPELRDARGGLFLGAWLGSELWLVSTTPEVQRLVEPAARRLAEACAGSLGPHLSVLVVAKTVFAGLAVDLWLGWTDQDLRPLPLPAPPTPEPAELPVAASR